MKKNDKGFSLILAMLLVIVISLLAITILEFVVPFSKDIKGVENSSIAYYQANSGIEEGVYDVYTRNFGGGDTRIEKTKLFAGTTSSSFITTSSGYILPNPGEGNSEFDKNFYIIHNGNPVQLLIGNGYFNTGNPFSLYLKVPNLDNSIVTTETLNGGVLPIINWQIISSNNTLNSNLSIIKANEINDSNNPITSIDMKTLVGSDLDGIASTFLAYYNANCVLSSCTLKLSVVNKLETTTSIMIPYLEWKLDLGATSKIPLRYTKLSTSGKAFGFKKDIEINIPSLTVGEAFDFTIFQ